MNQFIIKHFKKSVAVKCFIIFPDKRIRILYGIPVNNIVLLKGLNLAYVINTQDLFYSKGMPSYIFDSNNVNPKNPYQKDCIGEISSPTDLKTAINSKVATEILEYSSGNFDKGLISMIIAIISLVANIYIIYVLTGLGDVIQALIEKLNILLGV
jgi:hypothetical protein